MIHGVSGSDGDGFVWISLNVAFLGVDCALISNLRLCPPPIDSPVVFSDKRFDIYRHEIDIYLLCVKRYQRTVTTVTMAVNGGGCGGCREFRGWRRFTLVAGDFSYLHYIYPKYYIN